MSNNKRTTAILNALAKLPIFRGLSRDQLVKLLTICQKVNFKDSEIIFNQGENSDKLYILVKGAVAILINQVEVAKVAKPSTFGEIGIFLQEKRSATLKVLGEALFMVAPFDKIFSLMASDRILNNRVTRNVVRIISLKIKQMKLR